MIGQWPSKFAFLVALFATGPAFAQPPCQGGTILNPTPDACLAAIETDRPHKTDTARPIAPGHAQAEVAALELGLGRGDPEVAIWATQLKVGLSERLEAGAFYTVFEGRQGAASHGQSLAGRVKLLLSDPRGRLLWTFVPYLQLSVEGRPEVTSAQLFFACDVTPATSLELNVGPEWSFSPDALSIVATGALTYDIGRGLSVFGELYSDSGAARSQREKRLDAGLLLTVTRDVQIDAGVYFGLEGPVAPQTLFLGTSLRR